MVSKGEGTNNIPCIREDRLSNPLIPEDKYIELLDKNLEFLLQFDQAEINHPVFDMLESAFMDDTGSKEKMADLYKDPNLTLLYQLVRWAREFDKEEKYKKSFINLLKIIVVLYATNGWARSRIGWFIWAMVCGANPNSHYPLTWEGCFEPAKWYYAGECQREDYRVNSESGGSFEIPPL